MGSQRNRPSELTASGGLVAKVQADDGPSRVLSSEFTVTLTQAGSSVTVGERPAIVSASREVTLSWFQFWQACEQEALRLRRATEPVASIFKRPPGVEILILEDGRISCPQCAVVSPWGACELCDGEKVITLRRLEQWNVERPEDAWTLDDETEVPAWPS